MGPILREFLGLDTLPQTSFNEIRDLRAKSGNDIEAQRRLALEDRRAYAREVVQENGMLGAANMALSIPTEQAAKAVLATPVIGPVAQKLLNGLGVPVGLGRSGFNQPVMSVKAGYNGILQGLDDRGMFGRK